MPTYYGTNGSDSLTGGTSADTFYAYGGNDSVRGGSGGDYIDGGLGSDILKGEIGADFLYGGDGFDSLYGGTENDTIYGDAGNDLIDGGANNDLMYGGDGDDTFANNGLTGWDSYYGGAGRDIISLPAVSADASFGAITITVLTSIERIQSAETVKQRFIYADGTLDLSNVEVFGFTGIRGWTGADTITGTSIYAVGDGSVAMNDIIDGREGNDTLSGGAGNDSLIGGDGSDNLNGGTGNDTLTGALGNDTLIGSTGIDRFVFSGASGSDTIIDFANGLEQIDLRPTSAAQFSDLSLAATGSGGTIFTVDGTIIVVDNVPVGDFDASDFLF